MSTLKTHNLQSPDAGSVNIVMAPNAGMVVAGISTFNNKILLGTSDAGYPNYADNLTVSGTGNEGITIRSGATSQGAIYFSDTTGTAAGTYVGNIIYDHSDNHMRFATGGLERLRINQHGQIGIGTDTPTYPLQVHDSAAGGLLRLLSGHEGNYDLRFVYQNSEANIWSYASSDMTFGTRYAKKLHLVTNGPGKRLTIDDGGNVGINETSPSTYLHVKGTGEMLRLETTASGGGQCYIDFDDETATRASIGLRGSSSDTLTMAALNGTLRFDTSGKAQAMIIAADGKIGVNENSPDSLLHLTTNSSTAYSTSEVNTVNSTNALLRLENTNGGDGAGVNNYVGMYFRVGSGANSDSQLQYVREGDNAGAFHFKARNAGSTYPNLMTIKSDGNTGFDGVVDPKSPVHLGSNTEMRIGGQYGGLSPIMMQVQYAAGYTGTHWMFETNQMISWSFDGVLIVYGGGGSSYGSEVTKITIVYSRESGANNSGDIWRNGTTSYNIETLGHGQVGLNPSAGELTVTEDTAPDGAGSQRSLFKLGWTTAGHGGATTIWSKLHGTMYWGTGSSGDVEIQDKDGNIFWDSNP